MEDLNLLSEELLEQIFIYLKDINWEEDQLDEIMGYLGNRGRIRTRRQSNPITQLPIYKYISRGLQILNHI